MQIILSKQCESLTGSLGRGFGYFIQRRKERFFSQRSKHQVPPDGHWRFILACANLAQSKLYITDIRLSWEELQSALYEAHHFQAARKVKENEYAACKKSYNAADILNLKITFGL